MHRELVPFAAVIHAKDLNKCTFEKQYIFGYSDKCQFDLLLKIMVAAGSELDYVIIICSLYQPMWKHIRIISPLSFEPPAIVSPVAAAD